MTRENDELLLRILTLHRAGLTYREIGASTGLTVHQVKSRVLAVKKQDARHDPDNAPRYWRMK